MAKARRGQGGWVGRGGAAHHQGQRTVNNVLYLNSTTNFVAGMWLLLPSLVFLAITDVTLPSPVPSAPFVII